MTSATGPPLRAAAVLGRRIDEDFPFGGSVVPWIARFEQTVELTQAMWTETGQAWLGWALGAQLSRIAADAIGELYERFDPERPVGRYQRFIDRVTGPTGWDEVQNEFPVLGELLDRVTNDWIVACAELDHRVGRSRRELVAAFGTDGRWGPIDDVRAGLGDRHGGGRMVMALKPIVGAPVAYKPRSTVTEAWLYEQLAATVEAAGLRSLVPELVVGDGYGLQRWVRPGPVHDPEAFWRAAGATIAHLWWFGITDLHHENLIVVDDSLVPVDLECWGAVDQRTVDTPDDLLLDSILSTGLFAHWYGSDGPVAIEMCGLFSEGGRSNGTWLERWDDLGTDGMARRRVLGRMQGGANTPRTGDGQVVPPDPVALREGYETAREHLCSTATIVSAPAGPLPTGEPRAIMRGTVHYARALRRMTGADSLRDHASFADSATRLPDLAPYKRDWLGDRLEAFLECERRSLRRLEIPRFRAVGRDLVADSGERIRDVLPMTAAERLDRRRARDRGGLHRANLRLVSITCEDAAGRQLETARTSFVSRSATVDPADVMAGIAHHLRETALEERDRATWIEVERPVEGRWTIPGAGHTDLYYGSEGIACALAAAAAVIGDESLAGLAGRALWIPPFSDHGRNEGWPTGAGGRCYARLYVGRLLGDAALVAAGLDGFADIARELVTDDSWCTATDVMSRGGGWVLLASLAASLSDGPEITELAAAMLDSYTRRIARGWTDPVDGRTLRYIGFAHRTTGVAYALARAGTMLGSDDAIDWARTLAAAEEERVAGRGGIGAATNRTGNTRTPARGWCWGAAGYVLARTDPVVRAASDPANIRASLLHLAAQDEPGHSQLCCGDAGTLVALAAATAGDDPSLAAPARAAVDRLVSWMASSASGGDPFQWLERSSFARPSLFMGLAGTCWALARFLRPDLVPNLLLVE